MSSKKIQNLENVDFIKRFTEVCGSSKPACVARLLGVSYQAAKNYLRGRSPEAKILRRISEQTPYSIHWLLTGRGEKFAEANAEKKDTDILTGALRAFLKEECRQIIGEILNEQNQSERAIKQSRTVVLTPDMIKEEKVLEESENLSSKLR
ncbi:MAG: Bacteriophage repressor helix-turn-helix domain [Acidobacteria bacterium]|jgi:transcriptional regulator with XRE-family HTH domain|nr:Bacteriophage repressor helix-turn-helix domain [Acidobacteriota bacterium]